MSQPFRLPHGGQVDRDQPLRFTFDGRELDGYAGDTLASALLANGVRVVARSFKYHRPRGIFSAGEEEPSALLAVGAGGRRTPACRAPLVPLSEGLEVRSESGWPGLRFDLGRVFDLTHPLWPAGFYNKTFKWPRWETWEGLIRGLAGLGRVPKEADPDRYEQINAHCDLLVCGGGPAGLAAALVAGRAGARVIVAEQDVRFGGCLNAERFELDSRPAADWVEEVLAELRALPRVMLLPATTVSGIYDHNVTTLLQRGDGAAWRECLWIVRPRHVLLATGAIEQGLVFPANDRPGVMLAGAVRHYLHRYAVTAGRAALIATNNDSGYQTALDLLERDVAVKAVVDLREEGSAAARQQLAQHGVPLFAGARIAATRGVAQLREATVESSDGRRLARVRCDLLAVSGGWSSRLHLYCHARGRLRFDDDAQCFLPDQDPPGVTVTGAAAGTRTLPEALTDAEAAGRGVCERLGFAPQRIYLPRPTHAPLEPGPTLILPPRRARRRQWIDLAHDVTLDDAELAVREGYESVEHFKRYTTTGMAADQGKTGNLNAFLALSALTGRAVGEAGTTTFRPPYMPLTLAAAAGDGTGEGYAPRKLLPAHLVHETLGARFEDYGWQRPEHYATAAESREAAIVREVLAVRRAAGVFDNSPIGKIEVRGPDAAAFLHRFYINDVRGLKVGRSRYGLMLNENGVIVDDGILSRLAADHFLVNTTSAGVGHVYALLQEWLQCEWPDFRVMLTDVTQQWANFTVAGPRAREVLQGIGLDVDLSADALPHMSVAEGRWNGVPSRVVRASFSGEASFEINVPANRAGALLQGLLEVGRPLGLTPYGIEALMLLRLEKGYLHVGSDTDGQTIPDDVGWGGVARNKQDDYIGRRSLFRPASLAPDRRQLIGLEALQPGLPFRAGSHLLLGGNRRPPAPTDGWITSAAWSPTLERPIALALLRGGRDHTGATVTVIDGDARFHARVARPAFYDPENERLSS